MKTYIIFLTTCSYENARSLLESKNYNIVEYRESMDRLTVKGTEPPTVYFKDISPNPHDSNRFVW